MSAGTQDLYQLLGVRRNASPEELRAAYERLSQEYDQNPDKSAEAIARFSEIARAYDILSSPEKRAIYDELIPPEVVAPAAAPDSVAWTPLDVVKGLLLLLGLEIGGAVALAIVLLMVMTVRGDETFGGNQTLVFAAAQVMELLMFLVAWRFTVSKYRLGWSSLGFRGSAPGSNAIVWIGVIFIATVLATGFYGAIVTALGADVLNPGPTVPPELLNTQSNVVLFALLAMLVAPLAEETFFRGFVFAGLSKRYGFWWGAIISAGLFAVAHASIAALIPIFLVGLLLAWLYARTRSLWPCMAVHAMYNGLAVLAVLLNLPY